MALDRWPISDFPDPETQYELAEASDKAIVFFSLWIANSSGESTTLEFDHTDGSNSLFSWVLDKAAGESPTVIKAPLILKPGDKILVKSSQESVAIIASGETR